MTPGGARDAGGEVLSLGVVAPPWFEVPPSGYGGIELICYWLVEGLVERGHDVTLVAAGRDQTHARFARTFAEPPSERLGESVPEIVHALLAARALQSSLLDLVHDHSFAGPLLASARSVPTVVTAHSSMQRDFLTYYESLSERVSLVALSRAQQRLAPHLAWAEVVPNAIKVDDYPLRADKEDFLVFLGRMSPAKGAHLAIDAARAASRRLVLAGKCIEPSEKRYFASEIAPRLGPDIEWIGEADAVRKKDLLARARCLLFPIQWHEPFGIVMAEAMACGTPVVALRGGSVPEVVVDGVTGFVRDDPSELPSAIERTAEIDPAKCRRHAQDNFSVDAMVSRYESVYRMVLAERDPESASPSH